MREAEPTEERGLQGDREDVEQQYNQYISGQESSGAAEDGSLYGQNEGVKGVS